MSLIFKIAKRLSIINWYQAARWKDIYQSFKREEADDWIMVNRKEDKDCFAVRVLGDSMESSNAKFTVPEGSLIIVKPTEQVESGAIKSVLSRFPVFIPIAISSQSSKVQHIVCTFWFPPCSRKF